MFWITIRGANGKEVTFDLEKIRIISAMKVGRIHFVDIYADDGTRYEATLSEMSYNSLKKKITAISIPAKEVRSG